MIKHLKHSIFADDFKGAFVVKGGFLCEKATLSKQLTDLTIGTPQNPFSCTFFSGSNDRAG